MHRHWLLIGTVLLSTFALAACTTPSRSNGGGGNNASNNGASNNGSNNTVNNGGNNGTSNNGINNTTSNNVANNGASNNGISNNGTSNNGTSNNGTSNNGTSNNGTSNNGVVDSPTAGGGCMNERDCSANEYCIGASPFEGVEGYCTVLGCEDHADCNFAQGGTFCCSNFGEYRGCWQEADGATCGDESGTQGDDCAAGGQSDCAGQEHYCLDLYGGDQPFCSQLCVPGGGDCAAGTYCYATQADAGVCLPYGDTPIGEPCIEEPYSCGAEALCVGNWGEEPDPYSYCQRLCDRDTDCQANEWCQIWPTADQGVCSPTDGALPEGASCTEDRFGCAEGLFCLYEGTRYAHCVKPCRRDTDCTDGLVCQLFGDVGVCLEPDGRDNGASCADDPLSCDPGAFCSGGYSGFDPDAFCQASCADDPTLCGAGFTCVDFADQGSFCLPNGPGQHGDACTSALDCAEGHYCVTGSTSDQKVCVRDCTTDADCAASEWCTGEGGELGLCWPRGDRGVGESCADDLQSCGEDAFCSGAEPICFAQCTDDPTSCPADMYCLAANGSGDRWCYPRGQTPAGQTCTDAYACAEGSYCVQRGDAGLCLSSCTADADCGATEWCYRTRQWGTCLPIGGGQTGDGCGDSGFDCAEDHLCLYAGTPAAYCVQDCTGFASHCGEGEVCRFIGYGLNVCMPVGASTAGENCAADPQVCDAGSICAGGGHVGAVCAQLCSFDASSCPDGTTCVFSDGGLGTCLPPDFNPGDPLNGGGGPL